MIQKMPQYPGILHFGMEFIISNYIILCKLKNYNIAQPDENIS